MCGPTDAQTQLQQSQIDFYNNLQKQDATVFGQDQNILNQISSAYSPILAKGPNQYGFSADQDNILKSQATGGVARNYRDAGKALREQQATNGGGTDYLPSGVQQDQQTSLASSAADELSREELGIKSAGYDQGYKEFTDATSAMLGASGQLNPTAYAGTATSSGSAASSMANTIASQQNSWMAPLLGAVGSVGAGAATGYLGRRP